MKKFLLLLVCLFSLIGLTACENIKAIGTWEFSSLTMDFAGAEITINLPIFNFPCECCIS